jgi:guanylate kinase
MAGSILRPTHRLRAFPHYFALYVTFFLYNEPVNKLKLMEAAPPEEGRSAPDYDRLESDGLLIILDGASAVGKSTTAAELCKRGIVDATPTWTTRQPRPGEISTDYDHRFVSDEEFDSYEAQGGFMDQQTLYGNRYGIPFPQKPAPGKEALMILKPIFIKNLLEHYPYARVHQITASQDITEERMRLRGQAAADIAERLSHHDRETEAADKHSHTTFDNNGPLAATVAAVEQRIRQDRRGYDLLQLMMTQA